VYQYTLLFAKTVVALQIVFAKLHTGVERLINSPKTI
jgi:hypothetical protein